MLRLIRSLGLVDASSHMSTLSAAFDTHIDHLQTEADILQAALANPNNVSAPLFQRGNAFT